MIINKKCFALVAMMVIGMSQLLWAVPACPSWLTMTQPDGTTVELRQVGDEFDHYWINRSGQEMMLNDEGWWVEIEQPLNTEQRMVQRMKSPMLSEMEDMQRAPVSPLPTKMLVILVNYSDKSMLTAHNNAFFDDMLNKVDNPPYGSVRDYFIASSDGNYTPHFDVFGPVTLDHEMEYYGANNNGTRGNDVRAREMVWEACQKADDMGCNFADYDGNSDGTVDNIYVIYAGYAESSGGGANTIWPHSWSLSGIASSKLDGKTLSRYGCSAELDGASGSDADGIGTFAHEFSHVLGMPDYYDTQYGYNFTNNLTPGHWSLMDYGSYNGNGQRPPLYSIFDKCYMGWATMPPLLAQNAQQTISMPVGTAYAKHINGTTTASNYTSTDTVYYLENRQKEGNFDGALPGHGLVIWQVVYRSNWSVPNNTENAPRYTLLSATGSTTGLDSGKDPYPGTLKVTSKTVKAGCVLTDISETDGVISFKYNGGDATFHHTWIANGSTFTTTTSQASLTLPTSSPAACSNGRIFYGWTTQTTMKQDGSDLTLAQTGNAITSGMTYYAVYQTTCSPVRYSYLCDDVVDQINYTDAELIPGQSYVWNAHTYTQAGTYYGDTIKTIHGDQIAVLRLTGIDPSKVITYTGYQKLRETTIKYLAGVHTDAFDQSISRHEFSNGVGVIIFNGPLHTIGDYAFYNCRKATLYNYQLTSITLPSTITSIGQYAFYNCENLTSLVLPESVNQLAKYALQNCKGLQSITCEALTPPGCYSSTFSGLTRKDITLNVYPISLNRYKTASEWKEFFVQAMPCDQPAVTYTVRDTICQGESYSYRGRTFTQSTIYADTSCNRYGCDTVINRLELTVAPHYTFAENFVSCDGTPYTWHARVLNASGTYHDSLTTIHGCDSVYTLHFVRYSEPIHRDTLHQGICSGEAFSWRGREYSEAGLYVDTVRSIYGCDSAIHRMELTVHPVYALADSAISCYGEDYVWHGRSLSKSGVYYDSLQTIYGCDSVYTLYLKVLPQAQVDTLHQGICSGEAFSWRGREYSEAGLYVDTVRSIYGCDSAIHRLILTVHPVYALADSAISCYGEYYVWHGRSLSKSGVYYDSLQTVYGCDSVYTLYLKVMPQAQVDTLHQGICSGEAFSWRGREYSEAGLYVDTVRSIYGCDSAIHRLILTVHPVYALADSAISCYGEDYVWHGKALSKSGVYYDSLQTIYGCDSVYTLYLKVLPQAGEDTTRAEINEGDSIAWRGVYYTQEGTYADTTYTAFGCEEMIYFLELTVIPYVPSAIDMSATEAKDEHQVRKFIYQNKLYIEREGIIYDATGSPLRLPL